MPPRFGAPSRRRRANPNSKSAAIPKPVNTPPNALAWKQTKTNWNEVYPAGKSKFGALLIPERPPANAVKKKSGKSTLGTRSAGLGNALWSPRQATDRATDRVRRSELMSG